MSFKVIFKHSHPPNVFCELTRNVTGVIILLIYLLLHICFSNLWQRTPRIVTYHRENRIVLKVHLLVFPFFDHKNETKKHLYEKSICPMLSMNFFVSVSFKTRPLKYSVGCSKKITSDTLCKLKVKGVCIMWMKDF